LKFLDIKDSKGNRVTINVTQIKKITVSKGETLIDFGDKLYTRTNLTIDEILNKITI